MVDNKIRIYSPDLFYYVPILKVSQSPLHHARIQCILSKSNQPDTMEFSKVLVLSTAHLHPLEAAKIEKVAYISSDTTSLVNAGKGTGMLDSYLNEGMHCLVDLLRLVYDQFPSVDYVMFDPDANVEEQFREFTW